MAHGLNSVIKRTVGCSKTEGKTGVGSRRIFAPHFKLQVLDSYRNDADCKGNQRATARKYGIHRRQIQKWLQAESNLRNSVKGKEPEANPEAGKCELALRNVDQRRPHGIIEANTRGEARVPALSPAELSWPTPAPLDFTLHSRASPDLAAPMDLSLKRPAVDPPVPCCASFSPRLTSPVCHAKQDPDVWDLSTKRRCLSPQSPASVSTSSTQTTPKPVKLFKPYLDDLQDSSSCSEDCPKFTELMPPCCSSNSFHCDAYYYNNNNIICDVKSEYPYTIHELQPSNYFYSVTKTYMYPTPEYEHSNFTAQYDDRHLLQASPPLKQRQSYSLDFKLSAIECYYQDSVCRGNQRAVASKYNIHRRQVQKWLQQEEELRQRNEGVKQIHAVR